MLEKEALVKERNVLELQKLQQGHVVSQEMERVSVHVKSLEGSLQEVGGAVGGAAEEREQLSKERSVLCPPHACDVHPMCPHACDVHVMCPHACNICMCRLYLVEQYEKLKRNMLEGNLLSVDDQQKYAFLPIVYH